MWLWRTFHGSHALHLRTLGPWSSKAWRPGQQPLSSWGSGVMVVMLLAAPLFLSWPHLLSHSSDLFWLISFPRFYPRLWIHGQTLVCNSGLLLWDLTTFLTFPMLALQHLFLIDCSPLPQPPSQFSLSSTRALGGISQPIAGFPYEEWVRSHMLLGSLGFLYDLVCLIYLL